MAFLQLCKGALSAGDVASRDEKVCATKSEEEGGFETNSCKTAGNDLDFTPKGGHVGLGRADASAEL